MKHLKFILALLMLTFALPAANTFAQKMDEKGNYYVGTTTDTAKPNTTKKQAIAVGSASTGVTLQYNLTQLTDTCVGYVSVWASLNGTTYAPYPGIDSVAVSAATNVSKIWLINTKANNNPVKYIEVRTRLTSNTTNATGKAKVTTIMNPY